MTDIKQRQANRLFVLNAVYEASGGSENTTVSGPDLLASLNMAEGDLADACKYLEGEHLIKGSRTSWGSFVPFTINMTHRGVREMEQSLQAPTEPTQHFPPAVSIIHIEGNVIGSPIQSGSPGAKQEVATDINIPDIRDFLVKLKETAPELDLPEEAARELTAEIATLEAQVNSPKPKKQIIRESVHSIRAILEGTTGAMAATGLLDLLSHIHI